MEDILEITMMYLQPVFIFKIYARSQVNINSHFICFYYSVILQHKSATDAIYLNSKLHSELAIIKMQKSRKVKDENALTKLLFLKYIACTGGFWKTDDAQLLTLDVVIFSTSMA